MQYYNRITSEKFPPVEEKDEAAAPLKRTAGVTRKHAAGAIAARS